jgi:hypothetical protein
MIRSAANDELPYGWLYLPRDEIKPHTECVLLMDDTDDLPKIGAALGFPDEGLSTDDLKDIFHCAQRLVTNPSDDVMVRAFSYYLKFDAYLPSIDAPDPLSPEVVQRDLDREFYQSLGAEREGTVCRKAGCGRGAVAFSIFCKPDHFESVKQRPCPFRD